MDVILNELSLSGQFSDEDEFIDNLKEIVKITHFFSSYDDLALLKSYTFWESKITSNDTVITLLQKKGNDVVKKLRTDLFKLSSNPPYWEDNRQHCCKSNTYMFKEQNLCDTGIAESIERDKLILSFKHDDFIDLELNVKKNTSDIIVNNLSNFKYFIELLFDNSLIDEYRFCKYFFYNTNLNFDLLDDHNRGFNTLSTSIEKKQFTEQFKTFSNMSWEEIYQSDGFEYKKYNSDLSGFEREDIYKFRISQKYRCYGFRKNDIFKVVHFETNHKLSDNG